MEFGDLRSAARMRDLIERIASKTVDKKRPDVRIGYVNNYDSGRQLAWVKFPGDDELVKVRIALNMLPTRTITKDGEGLADIVRVAGRPGAYYVTDFVRGVPQNPDNIPIVDVNFNNQKGINAADATAPQDVLNLRTADARYATAAQLGGKEPTIPTGTSGQYVRGDKQLGTMDKAAVGLANVDNTSDANKPISTATQNALNLKAPIANPTFTGTVGGITKAMVGLGNVDNTADSAKPVSTAQQTALNAKADLVGGVIPDAQLPPLAILDTHVVASEAAMLALVAQKGDVAVRTDINKTFRLRVAGANVLANWTEMPAAGAVTSVAGKTGTVSLVKGDVGLGSVDNTSDAAKPVSTAQQTALNLKADKTAVVDLTTAQNIDGQKAFVKPVMVLGQSAPPATPSGAAILYALNNDYLPRWMGPDGIERPLIPPREAVHDNPNFESWSMQSKSSGQQTNFPVGWNPFWQSDDTVNTQDAVDKVSGSYSLRVARAAGTGAAARIHGTTVFPVNPGDTVTFDIYMKANNTAGYVGIGMISSDTAGGADFYSGNPATQFTERNVNMTTSWRKYTVSFIVPAGNYYARFSLWPTTLSTTAAITYWFDDSGSSISTPAGGQAVLPGEIKMWPSATVPEGYLRCDGTVYNNVDYPNLAAVLGTTFGGVAGTSFAVPDFRRRVPNGYGVSVAVGRSDGLAEASRTFAHTHTTPNHTHTDSFALNIQSNTSTGGTANRGTGITGGITSSGGGTTGAASYDTVIPYLTVNFIIKT